MFVAFEAKEAAATGAAGALEVGQVAGTAEANGMVWGMPAVELLRLVCLHSSQNVAVDVPVLYGNDPTARAMGASHATWVRACAVSAGRRRGYLLLCSAGRFLARAG